MCPNNKAWCMGHGYFDASRVCLKCRSADSAHTGMALRKPPPASFAGRVNAGSGLSAKAPVGNTGLMAAPTTQRPLPSAPKKSANTPVVGPGGQSSAKAAVVEHVPTDPYARQPNESEARWEARVIAMKKKEATAVPASYSGHVFRGEDPASAGKPGRTTAEMIGHGGFLPWQCTKLSDARANLEALCSGERTLMDTAYAWQKNKNKVDGFFVSTGTNSKEAYDNYTYFYRAEIPNLTKREWNDVGLRNLNPDNVRNCHLFTDKGTIADSSCIAVLCLVEANRIYELLVMTPIPFGKIEVKEKGAWVPVRNAGRA